MKRAEGNLENMIRALAANGELTHLSLTPVAGKGPGGIGWAASYSPASRWANGFGRHPTDPVEAIKMAINDERMGEIVGGLRKTLKKSAEAGDTDAKAALAKLPTEVDDSDFLGDGT